MNGEMIDLYLHILMSFSYSKRHGSKLHAPHIILLSIYTLTNNVLCCRDQVVAGDDENQRKDRKRVM